MEPFLLRALLAGLALAAVTGPLGALVVWRRMAYFGDAMAHAAVLGVALSLLLAVAIPAGILGVAVAVALLLAGLAGRGHAVDALLGVVAHGGLAGGLLLAALLPGRAANLEAWLFGDILAVSWSEVAAMAGAAVVLLAVLMRLWPALVLEAVSEEIAAAEGHRPQRDRLVLLLLLAVLVAVGIRLVGAILVSALLVIPAAGARPLARGPEAMAALGGGLAALAVAGGLWVSWILDLPAGPAIVEASVVLFLVALMIARGLAWRE